ncbi:GTP cyclohydrolase FolE2 [Thermosediminibacter oceani]|uniref:GTP cyclohydrolase FolE2 n=1 Tax=Thermosediminibacter oceani (strain ATCC BAA-1034 / DSM 16646 / JW/IW-1228P) TaxID=555079 RepID=D9S1R7_THEOJ|nr:GTP cyclohydrolase I [Thermosediminibacter oceani DSM 16646]
MKDVQSERDERRVPLKKVGVKNIEWPLKVLDKSKGYQHTVARMSLSVDLKHYIRGTHMSRFVEVLNDLEMLSPKALDDILTDIKERLKAENSHLEISFPYFIWKVSPVSGLESPLKIEAMIEAEKRVEPVITMGVRVPVHTLCPCSKEISENGAHNQRAVVEIYVRSREMIWFEDLVEIAEKNASCPIYTLLKRPDEKFVTEMAYKNAKFVEDVTRDVALELERDERIEWYRVQVTSFESIHNHDAFACVEKGWIEDVARD